MTVKSTINLAKNLTKNDTTHESAPGKFTQYLMSFLASLNKKKKSMSPPRTAAVNKGLTAARRAIPNRRNAT